ncbi:YaaL family protein [Faecalicatena contorta]|uniref:YaaL family protein n=1 Tax=Faecalicatena fissicatena TaxID=290055 RepID=A0ABS2EA24_9FIRM|nr:MULTISPECIES: YaaL family protein [Clostridia]MBM6686168.1 YaaL family protein [Faecalicatena contorta]MBM6711613.1 YaaL family protein [Faecalicatena contorta]MBM6738470.1 YaaL family protein [Faecalicatena fissicatena]HIX98337.1 YaaL family protein [Candidatus Dorea intestinigallinarum]
MKLFQRGRAAEEDIYKRLSFDRDNFDIAEEIAQARQEIEDAYNNFQNACDPDLIDCYIYRGNAAWKRYCFLLRQAKAIQS